MAAFRLLRESKPVAVAVLGLILLAQPCHAFAYMLKYERTEKRPDSEVLITGHGTATCFKPGKLLTAAHNCFNGDTPLDRIFILVGKDWKPVRVVRTDKDIDVALIECPEAEQFTPLGPDPKLKDRFTLTGSKRGAALTSPKGQVISLWYKGRANFLAEVKFDHGDSGGPIIMDGRIGGMAVAGLPLDGDIDTTKCLFVPATVLRSFLAD